MYIDVDNHKTYIATGSKEHIDGNMGMTFIHGTAMDHTVWTLAGRHFARRGLNILAVDLPGHGRSEGDVIPSIEGMADWVVKALDASGQDKTIIVGHSMGSLVAFDVAARYPDRIKHLAMVGTSIPMPVGDLLLDSAKEDKDVAKEMVNFWSHSQAAHLGGSQVPGTWMIGKLGRLLERSGPGVIYNDLKACHDYVDGIERSKQIQAPTLLILGEDDFMTPVRNAKDLAENIPQSSTVMLPNCGHAIVNEAPNEMLDALATIV